MKQLQLGAPMVWPEMAVTALTWQRPWPLHETFAHAPTLEPCSADDEEEEENEGGHGWELQLTVEAGLVPAGPAIAAAAATSAPRPFAMLLP